MNWLEVLSLSAVIDAQPVTIWIDMAARCIFLAPALLFNFVLKFVALASVLDCRRTVSIQVERGYSWSNQKRTQVLWVSGATKDDMKTPIWSTVAWIPVRDVYMHHVHAMLALCCLCLKRKWTGTHEYCGGVRHSSTNSEGVYYKNGKRSQYIATTFNMQSLTKPEAAL